ncbi:enoyl-CoA hydratase [Desertibaculum subflavum]|uniref:enoyl-CoA hydratase n=1 Tax=Desertibaculum subflavum TaxID=2268458 RepID=UPI000E6721C2
MAISSRVGVRIQQRDDGEVAWLTIQRPEKLNAMDPEAIAALTEAAGGLRDQAGLRAVVLTGAGPKAFIGGADIKVMAGLDPTAAEAFITSIHRAIAALRALPVPVIARVNGYCLGAGLEVAAGCDLRIASANAVFGMPEVKIGMPSVIEAALLPRLIGWGRASEMLLLGENIDAAEAHRIGLVEKVVAPEALDAAVEAWLGSILAAGPEAVRLQKSLMRQWETLTLDQAVRAGIGAFRASFATGEPNRMAAPFAAGRRH